MEPHTFLIYLVDDEADIREVQTHFLKQKGFNVISFANAEKFYNSMEYLHPDLVISSIVLPGINGLELCKFIKTNNQLKSIPVILTSTSYDKVSIEEAFNNGADDFLAKPFNMNELHARLNKLLSAKPDATHFQKHSHSFTKTMGLKRKSKTHNIRIRDLNINLDNHEVSLHNSKLSLSHTEFQLLVLLITNMGFAYTREEIIKHDGGQNYYITDRAVDVRVAGLRKKLRNYGQMIKTIRSVGYMFVEI